MEYAERPEGWIADPVKARVMAEVAREDMNNYCADRGRSREQFAQNREYYGEMYQRAAEGFRTRAEEKADTAGWAYDLTVELTAASD